MSFPVWAANELGKLLLDVILLYFMIDGVLWLKRKW